MNKNFVLKSATSLSKEEMKNVRGGVSRKEYCATLRDIVHFRQESGENLTDGEIDGIELTVGSFLAMLVSNLN